MFPSSRLEASGNCSTTTLSRRSKNLIFPSISAIPIAVQHTYFTTKLSTLIFPLLACGRPPPSPLLIPYLFQPPLRRKMVRLRHSLPASPRSMIPPTWPSPPVQPHLRHQILHTHQRSAVPPFTRNLISRLMTSLHRRRYLNSRRPKSHREGCSIRYDTFLRSRSRAIAAKRNLC